MGEPGGSEGGGGGGGGSGGGGGATITTTTTTTTAAAVLSADDLPVGFSVENVDPALVATMTADELKKFIDTGRTGRRNALPDVTQPEAASTSTAGVAEAMESLNMQSDKGNSSSTGPAGGS